MNAPKRIKYKGQIYEAVQLKERNGRTKEGFEKELSEYISLAEFALQEANMRLDELVALINWDYEDVLSEDERAKFDFIEEAFDEVGEVYKNIISRLRSLGIDINYINRNEYERIVDGIVR